MSFYYYLIASLPMLRPDDAGGMTLKKFMDLCEEHVSPSEMDILKNASLENVRGVSSDRNLALWEEREREMRNQLVVLRAKRSGLPATDFLFDEREDLFVSPMMKEIFEEPSPLKAENRLNDLRWSLLNELETGHYFDFDHLVIYCLKLQLIEKMSIIEPDKGMAVLDSILSRS